MAQKVAVIEDDAILREILVNKLTQEGFEVVSTDKGGEAVALITENKPSLILLDILLPEKSGLEILEAIKGNAEMANTPVIAISNSGDAAEIEKAKELGVQEFLVKALFDSNDVLGKVQGLLGMKSSDMPQEENTNTQQAASAPAEPTPSPEKPQAAPIAEEVAVPAPTPTNEGPKNVLIVEDDAFLREIAAKKLQAEGFSVSAAGDGNEAIEKISQQAPDIIVLDLILPELDGFGVLEKVRTNPATKDTPVIILSNLGQEEDIEKAKSLGATDYLVKAHFSFGEIVKKIHSVLGQ